MISNTKISLIVAFDLNGGISKQGVIPWKIKADTSFFHDVTTRVYQLNKNNSLIMGRKTWQALPASGLKDRIIIVVSSTCESNDSNNTYFVTSLSAAIEFSLKLNLGKIFICGGTNIYLEALSLDLDEIYITKINKDYECDNIFPINELNLILPQYKKQVKTFNDISFIKYYKEEQFCIEQFCKKQENEEQKYLDLLYSVLTKGHLRQTRNSMTWSMFGKTLEFDLSNGFPLLTTKRMFLRGVFEELLFFLRADTNTKHLFDKGINIWNANTSRAFLDSVGLQHYQNNTMGPMYGYQLRHFGADYHGPDHDYQGQGVDQVAHCLHLLKTDPYSRRIMMTTFNPAQVTQGVLWPCHGITILFNIEEGNRLSCMMTQRSVDMACGLPFNICSYALLVHLFCEVINNDITYKGSKYKPGRLIMNLGDAHIYKDHYDAVIKQILREPYNFPQLVFNRKVLDLVDFKYEDLELIGYQHYSLLKLKMVV